MGVEEILSSIQNEFTPEEQDQTLSTFAGVGDLMQRKASGEDPRKLLYDTLSGDRTKLKDTQSDLLSKLSQPNTMSRSQVAGMLLVGLLPTLIGGIAKGKKGITAGAQAGALGTQVMNKGLKENIQREDRRNALQLQTVNDELSKNTDLQGRALLDEANSADRREVAGINASSRERAAGIRAGGDHALAKAQTAALRQDLMKQDKEEGELKQNAARQIFNLPDNSIAVNKGRVSPKTVDSVRDNDFKYKLVHDRLTEAVQKVNSTSMAERVWGTEEANEIKRLWGEAKNAWTDIKKIPGIKDSESYVALEDMMKDPTGIFNNIGAALAGKETIKEQLVNMAEQAKDSRRRSLEAAGYDFVKMGQTYTTKSGKSVRLIGIKPDGSLDYEAVE